MLRKLLSLGVLVVVALALGAGPAAAKHNPPSQPDNASGFANQFGQDGFSDGRFAHAFGQDGFSDGRFG